MVGGIDVRRLLEEARHVARFAYAPYSDFPVGAALLCSDGSVYTGVNVENVSYGLTICAERVALGKAVSEGRRDFAALAVVAEKRPGGEVTPCGACRQVMAEFLKPDAPVWTMGTDGQPVCRTVAELLPAAFDAL